MQFLNNFPATRVSWKYIHLQSLVEQAIPDRWRQLRQNGAGQGRFAARGAQHERSHPNRLTDAVEPFLTPNHLTRTSNRRWNVLPRSLSYHARVSSVNRANNASFSVKKLRRSPKKKPCTTASIFISCNGCCVKRGGCRIEKSKRGRRVNA